MDCVGGNYFIQFFKGEDDLTELVRFLSLRVGREHHGRECTVAAPIYLGRGRNA